MTSNTPQKRFHQQLSQDIKHRASGQWRNLIGSLCNLDEAILDGKHHPCPLCGGTDRFRVFDDFNTTGGMFCNQCHDKQNADGFASVMWLLNCDFPTAVNKLADTLGILPTVNGNGKLARKPQIVATYDYRDESGNLLFQVVRMEPGKTKEKDFLQRQPKPGNGWDWNVKGVRTVPYRLPELHQQTDFTQPVFIVEGEKDADRLAKDFGLLTTCNAGGAGNWVAMHSTFLRGWKLVVILSDHDESGRKHAQAVARSLHETAMLKRIKIVELPGLPERGDVSDWLNAGGTLQELKRLVEAAPLWTPSPLQEPEPVTTYRSGEIILPFQKFQQGIPAWPDRLPEEALSGLAGEIVRLIEPHTEADPAALLLQLLAFVGNAIGSGPFVRVEANRHPARLFVVIVGESSKARKGTSLGWIEKLFRLSGGSLEQWLTHCKLKGVTSGEAIIHCVRDPTYKQEPVKQNGEVTGYQEVLADPGVDDKRLMIIEGEFARLLKIADRSGNSVSPILREAWDQGDLRNTNKNSPDRTTGAHISIAAHITNFELQRCLSNTDTANGYANRFLWVCSRRSKCLPEGGNLPDDQLRPFAMRLAQAIEFASEVGEVTREGNARQLWREIYPELSAGTSGGVYGMVTSRAEAQVLRLSLVYALLDCSKTIQIGHLMAALAVWQHCDQSALHIFGNRLGNKTADEIDQALHARADQGMSRTEISEMFNRNKSSTEITNALHLLKQTKRADFRIDNSDSGRNPEVWFSLSSTKETNNTKEA